MDKQREELEMCIYEDLDNLVIHNESGDTFRIEEFVTTDELTQIVDCILDTIQKVVEIDAKNESACISDGTETQTEN